MARLAAARENQPYVVPVYVAYDEKLGSLYGFTFPGQKVEWMRANPRVCAEVDEIVAEDQWMTVIGIGRYEELAESAEHDAVRLRFPQRPPDSRDDPWDDPVRFQDERQRAWQLLKDLHPVWWEPACTAWAARVHRNPAEPIDPIYFKIRLDQVTGHQAMREVGDPLSGAARPLRRWDRLRGTLTRVFGS